MFRKLLNTLKMIPALLIALLRATLAVLRYVIAPVRSFFVFYCLISPVSLILQRFRKKPEKTPSSYWQPYHSPLVSSDKNAWKRLY